ncbi:MAG: tetraacyldisaccharide 4'-kinase [Prevotella sp.]|nr:tetraacyldisaccharide 4'-kinase [Prevotella sp.]
MEGDHIKVNKWLLPLSWLYGLAARFRNKCFELGILKSRSFSVPVISVGNISVGGSGKTPHVEYLVNLLKDHLNVAVLSRGYKRKSKGYQLASPLSTVSDIGDEPFQMKKKFPHIHVAVDANRCEGIDRLTHDDETKNTDVILLDDAYQHRYVKPGINILLVDYHRLIIYDKLLPAGRLREPKEGKRRADMVIITKCPEGLNPIDYRVVMRAMDLYPYQTLLFSRMVYDKLHPLFCGEDRSLESIGSDEHVLAISGIASPEHFEEDLRQHCTSLTTMRFSDHHDFTPEDEDRINSTFESLPSPKLIITTEKDAVRMMSLTGLSEDVRHHLYVLPIKVSFLLGQEDIFTQKIFSYVQKNSRNSILATGKVDLKPKDSNRAGDRPRTISF